MGLDNMNDRSIAVTDISTLKTSPGRSNVNGIPSPVLPTSITSSHDDVIRNGGADSESEVKTVDDIIKCLGSGPFSYLALLAGGLAVGTQPVSLVGSEFTAPAISFICADPLNEVDVYPINGTECFVTVNTTEDGWPGGEETPCKAFIYDNSVFESTVTTDFDLVCSLQFYRTLYQLIYTIGSVLGVLVGGLLSERFGRQRVLWYCMLGVVVVTLLQVFVPVLGVVLTMKFLLGVLNMCGATASFVLMMEVAPPHLRTIFGIVVAVPYPIMLCLVAVISYSFRTWKMITLLGSVPGFLLAFTSNPLLLGESPRWLVIRGNLVEAERVIRRAAKINKTTEHLPPNLSDLLHKIRKNELKSSDPSADGMQQSLWSLVSSSPMRRLLFLMGAEMFSLGALVVYIPLATDSVKSPFVYFFVMGLVELPSYSFPVPMASRFGRRWVTSICNFMAAAMQALLALCLALKFEEDWLKIAVAGVTYMLICSTYQITQMFTSELYPTSVRTLGASIIMAMVNLGFCLPPLLDYVKPESLPWLQPLIYSFLALGASVVVLFLPETNGAPLLETVAEYKQTYGTRKKDIDRRNAVENGK